jgi:hypothetical protein
MEAGFIRFDPASEFEVVESIDFEEEIQRPESLRFFTLDEQLIDYFDKVLPKKKNITKFEYTKVSREVDRLREIYNDTITVTDTDYLVSTGRSALHIDWVHPIYSNVELVPYSYSTDWNPLYTPALRSTANYYPRMLSALPKPYKHTGTQGVKFDGEGVLVDEEGKNEIHALGTWQRTKGVIHEDGSFTVVKVPVLNTSDDVHVKGFFIDKRPFEIPKPLAGHPFLESNTPSTFLTDEPLQRVFPTIEAIMTHGVPVTKNPYTEGKQYLKIYDITLQDIHWNIWKESFPPADPITVTPTILSVGATPTNSETAPSKALQDIYSIQWFPGLEPRFWLSKQEDNGAMVRKMLLSNSAKFGLLPPAITAETPQPSVITSTPEECLESTNFQSFMNSGVYRSPAWKDVDTAVDKHKPLPLGVCVPVSQIVQEKSDFVSAGKIAWKETTDVDILKEHQQLLKFFQTVEPIVQTSVYEKHATNGQSDTRRQIVALLQDKDRYDIDKVSAIEKVLRGSTLQNEIFYDSEHLFLACSHTLAELRGDLEKDKDLFYETWTAIDEGYRSCKFCGQQINKDVFVVQDDFDENGNVIVSHDVLGDGFRGEPHVAAFSNSLAKLKQAFLLDNAGEAILYLLLSLLQVLPDEMQLIPVIQNIRELTAVLRSNKKIDKSAKERTEGILGIAGMVVLLQTHNPFLIPRRSFGSKILKLSGFPRDTDDVSNSPVLDIIISVLRTTFESSPNTFRGPTTSLLRLILSKPKDVRKESIVFVKQCLKKFETQFKAAKERYQEPVGKIVTTQLSLPVIHPEKTVYTPSDKSVEEQKGSCNIAMPSVYLTGRLPPDVVQQPIILASTKPSNLATLIDITQPSPQLVLFSEAEIRRRANLDFPKAAKLEKIDAFLKSDTDGISFLALLNRILDVLSRESFSSTKLAEYRTINNSIKTTIGNSLLRDLARGVICELMQEVVKDQSKTKFLQALSTAVKRDLVFSMILLTKEEATTQDSDLRTRERELFKTRMRNMNDTEREATKMLLDIGIAPYIITNEDREIFAREYRLPDPELEYSQDAQAEDIDRPEEGYNAERDMEDGEAAIVNGVEQQVDYGDYGDRREERLNRDYETNQDFDYDEGYGV